MNYFKEEDRVLSELEALYESHGYKRYKPGCFEDYALYIDNIDFLISKNVVTFSGAEGKLLALRPDVTLSIVSRVQPRGETLKLFYTEKVYRRPEGGGEFRDINQTGVEVIGNIDEACEAEVASLIIGTLAAVSDDYMLDISHMGYTEGLMDSMPVSPECKREAYACLRSKNVHDFAQLAGRCGLGDDTVKCFAAVANIGGDALSAVKAAKALAVNERMSDAADQMEKLVSILKKLGCGDRINVNFSIANNADYYNGLIFNGYIGGVPRCVLSGGRYDKLLAKLKKTGGAIGFALYLGELERFFKPDGNFVDYLILYDDVSQAEALERENAYIKKGFTVRIARAVPEGYRFGKTEDLRREND